MLVDGNNVMFALADRGVDAGRAMLSVLLGRYADENGLDVTVVFDGGAPRGGEAKRLADPRISAYYSGGRTADDVLADLIGAYSAPRNLTVVSSDRAVKRVAKRRRCKTTDAASFAEELTAPPRRPPKSIEPTAKRDGLAKGQLDKWLAEFGMTDRTDRRRDSGED